MMLIDEAIKTGLKHHEAGRLQDAEHIYRAILAGYPDQPDALHLLGLIARRAGQLNDAEKLVRRAVEIVPSSPHFLGNLGLILVDQKKLDEAVTVFHRAIGLDPGYAQAHNNLGVALRDLGKFDESIPAFQQAIRLRANFAEAHSNLSSSLTQVGLYKEAVEAALAAVQLNPDLLDARYNLGNALFEAGRLDEAVQVLSQVIAAKPDHFEALNNLGNALRNQGRLTEAIPAYFQAIAYYTAYAEAHWNLSLAALMSGDFELGWFEHEWRFQCDSLARPRVFPQPQWHGEPLAGRPVLLHAEQGLGDGIQFVRYAPMVASAGGVVILQCQPSLVGLFQTVPGIMRVISRDESAPEFELQCPLMSLPLAFSTRLESVPAEVPYLSATKPAEDFWQQQLGPDSKQFKVGLVWAGSSTHQLNRDRSMKLAQFLPLAGIPGIQFVSLQKGNDSQQLSALEQPWKILDFTSQLNDFTDTAGLISQLDLVISVDTSVAHLAGAMAKPVWVLLPFSPDWRWMLDRSDSPWYPTMRLFRQTSAGDWAGVIEQVRWELMKQMESRA